MQPSQDQVQVRVEINLTGVERSHPAYELAVQEFTGNVNEAPELGYDISRRTGVGSKGSVEELFVWLGAGGAAVLTTLIRNWVKRDRDRSVIVEIDDGKKFKISVSGENISLAGLQNAIETAVSARESDKKKRRK